jgi:hypothetical protein
MFRKINLVKINGIRITPWHPIKHKNEWKFPAEIDGLETVCEFIDYTYDCVLEEGGNSININGLECLTLGHNIDNDPVASHSYFGSKRIIEDLIHFTGWDTGLVELTTNNFVRHETTYRIIALA